MRARGKDEVLPQPDGSILSGGTVCTGFHQFTQFGHIIQKYSEKQDRDFTFPSRSLCLRCLESGHHFTVHLYQAVIVMTDDFHCMTKEPYSSLQHTRLIRSTQPTSLLVTLDDII